MKKSTLLCLIALFVFLLSCRTDFDVNEEWEDITVVFGLLDQADSAHYLRINKTFLGNEDAYIMAQSADSLYYEDLVVTLEEWKDGHPTKSFSMCKSENEFVKEEGIFANFPNILYKTTEKLDSSAEYRLSIYIPGYDKEVTASTQLIHGLHIDYMFLAPQKEIGIISDESFKIGSAENAKVYDVILRFHYYETYDEMNFVHDSIDWRLPQVTSGGTAGGENIEISFAGSSFQSFLLANLEENTNIRRVARSKRNKDNFPPSAMDYTHGAFDIVISMGGQDLYTYITVSAPSQGIVQEKPAFTNISDGGLGLFSCRNSRTIYGKEMGSMSIDTLALSASTKKLNFADSQGNFWWED
ncbi:MAG: DUF4249 family protein [Bacteroidetes bacterium]|nr:DUF4249 family protein [Bacteroidota bacterium]